MTTTIKPTPERHQHDRIVKHHDTGEAGRVARRVQPPIEMLFVRGSIDQRQYDAAVQWRGDYEIGILGGRDLDGELPPGVAGGTVEGYTARQLDAARSFRGGQRAMGPHCSWIAEDVVLRGAPLREVAARERCNQTKAMGVLDAALWALARYYRV